MSTLKQLAAKHGINPNSLKVWLSRQPQIGSEYRVIKGRATRSFDRDAAAAVAEFLANRPRVKPGRPPKLTAKRRTS
jgi:hypothetical protein